MTLNCTGLLFANTGIALHHRGPGELSWELVLLFNSSSDHSENEYRIVFPQETPTNIFRK